jgi:transcriptional regulator with GAF, ATPase, and Fis domain
VLVEAAGGGNDAPAPDLPPHAAGAALRGKGGLLGALAVRRPPERPFIGEDRELLRLFASKAGRPLENALQYGVSQEELSRVSRALHDGVKRFEESLSWGGIIGRSPGLREAIALLDKVKDADLPVLILGESGTGKELAARALHFRSPRRDRMFVSENCAAIPESLLESELFGHVRGAFTGAETSRKGLLEAADGGTLFLDEVGDMSLPMQAKLLRFLQEGEFRPVGGRENRRVDVRVVAATNRDHARLSEDGGFRNVLYFRLSTVIARMPPLRECREDVPLLAETFLARAAREEGGERKAFTAEAIEMLKAYAWPGNVRELQNEVLRCAVMCPGRAIGPEWLSPQVREGRPDAAGPEEQSLTLKAAVKETEKTLIQRALAACGGNKTHAARMLGLSWLGLQKKMDRYGLR